MKILPFWLWVVVMVVLVIVGIASGDPAAFLVVGASIGLTALVVLVKTAFDRAGSQPRKSALPDRSPPHSQQPPSAAQIAPQESPAARRTALIAQGEFKCTNCGKRASDVIDLVREGGEILVRRQCKLCGHEWDLGTLPAPPPPQKPACPHCGRRSSLTAPPSTFYAECPHCHGFVYIGP